MPLHALVGPPASGRTHRLLARAHETLRRGGRVWWVALPAQRAAVIRRATHGPDGEARAVLGLEVLTAQQLYYRMLARARRLRPLVIGSERLVLVGEALARVSGEVPAPGEARLFAYAIAEAKRFALPAQRLGAGADPERDRLAAVLRAYEDLKGERWDYDDFRSAALELARVQPEACEAQTLIVDGFRELGPLEQRLLRAVADAREVHVSLAEAPDAVEPDEVQTLPPRPVAHIARYLAPNPVVEARWVLRALKRDLAVGGYAPLDLAVVVPRGRAAAVAALADEYGVPIMDETPRSLADTARGHALVDLLALPDYPTASRLLALPGLERLADAALDAGVAGDEALTTLAERLGAGAAWRGWRERLRVGDDPTRWARWLVDEVLPGVLRSDGARTEAVERSPDEASDEPPSDASDALDPTFRESVLRAAQEAARLAGGDSFRAWWSALLQQARAPNDARSGVALLDATLASGRRFRRVYLMGATEGAYRSGEAEDYFVPEEDRADRAEVGRRMPHRFQGRDAALRAELLSRGDEVVVTGAEADQGGPMVADPALLGVDPGRPPDVPAGSPLELPTEAAYHAPGGPLALGTPTLERLRRHDACAFRAWGETLLPDPAPPWWVPFLRALREAAPMDEERAHALGAEHPEAAEWLRAHAERLGRYTYGVLLPADGDGPRARVDAAWREGARAVLVRFTGPDRVADEADAEAYVKGRWNELWAAGHLLERYRGRIERVDVLVWPVLGEPIDAFPRGIRYPWRTIRYRQRKASEALAGFRAGSVEPSPGFHCRDCPVFDLCRQGRRT